MPLPLTIHTRICPPIYFERYGNAAAKDRDYVEKCYQLVKTKMQLELDYLAKTADILPPLNLNFPS